MTNDQCFFHIRRHLWWAMQNDHPPEALAKLAQAYDLVREARLVIEEDAERAKIERYRVVEGLRQASYAP